MRHLHTHSMLLALFMLAGCTHPASHAPGVSAVSPASGHYRVKGNVEIRPQSITDDGMKTYIVWGTNQPLPAVFTVDDAGREQVVDGEMRGGSYVLDSVANRLVFRLDDFIVSAVREPRLQP